MKKQFFSLIAAGISIGFVACNNSGDTTATTDSTTMNTTTANTSTSTNNYSAMADTVERNSQSGYYLNPKTGKPLTLKVDRSSGKFTDATTGEPVWRYVDNRTWWVYGGDRWDTMGAAKMQGNNLMYRDANGNWVNYEKRWKEMDDSMHPTMDKMNDSGSMENMKMSDGGNKMKDENMKVKVSDDGKKIKIKKQDRKD